MMSKFMILSGSKSCAVMYLFLWFNWLLLFRTVIYFLKDVTGVFYFLYPKMYGFQLTMLLLNVEWIRKANRIWGNISGFVPSS